MTSLLLFRESVYNITFNTFFADDVEWELEDEGPENPEAVSVEQAASEIRSIPIKVNYNKQLHVGSISPTFYMQL